MVLKSDRAAPTSTLRVLSSTLASIRTGISDHRRDNTPCFSTNVRAILIFVYVAIACVKEPAFEKRRVSCRASLVTERPWYNVGQQLYQVRHFANASIGTWTAPYIFSTNGLLGMTYVIPFGACDLCAKYVRRTQCALPLARSIFFTVIFPCLSRNRPISTTSVFCALCNSSVGNSFPYASVRTSMSFVGCLLVDRFDNC